MSAANDELVLTVDGGGSSVKASVYSLTMRAPVAVASQEVVGSYSTDGLAEFDTEVWWEQVMAAVKHAIRTARRPASAYVGITCTGMRGPFVLIDDHGDAAAPGVLVADRRKGSLANVLEALGPADFYRLTGHWLSAGLGLPKLLWYAQERPDVWRNVRHVLQFHDWLVYRLSGALVSEPSSAAMSQLLDVEHRTWASPVLDAVGLDHGLFPELRDGGQEVDGLLPAAARKIGLRAGTPVFVGAGDTHLAVLGAGGTAPGKVTVVGGSTTPIMHASADPRVFTGDAGPFVSPHAQKDRWAAETNTGATGTLFTWLRDLVGASGDQGYAALCESADSSPVGARGLLITGPAHLWSESAWGKLPPTGVLGIVPSHRIGDLARAVLESIAHAIRSNLDALETSLGSPIASVVFTGGASRSSVGCRLLADILGRTVLVPDVDQPAAVGGAVLIAGEQARGEYPTALYEPDPERVQAYVEHAIRYRNAYRQLQESFGR